MPYRKRRPARKKSRPNKYNPRKLQLLKKPHTDGASRIINFKRTFEDILTLNAVTPPTNWQNTGVVGDNGIVAVYNINLNQIPNVSNFANLFDSYRIKGVRIQGYCSFNTTSPTSQAQSIMYMCRDHLGQNPFTTLTEDWFVERPRSKKRLLVNAVGKPSFDMFIPATQLGMVYASATNTDYIQIRPKFISTNELNTPHYLLNLRIQRIDGNNWTHNTANQYPTIKMFTTVYFQMKGINS